MLLSSFAGIRRGGIIEDITQIPRANQTDSWHGGDAVGPDDDLYHQAKEIVIQSGKASASLLQRRLRVGYARAARLLDMLEDQGVIGPGDGAKPREVLIGEARNIPGNPKTGGEEVLGDY